MVPHQQIWDHNLKEVKKKFLLIERHVVKNMLKYLEFRHIKKFRKSDIQLVENVTVLEEERKVGIKGIIAIVHGN